MDAKELAELLKDYADRREAPLLARIEALEQARTMRFCGPFDPATSYGSGAVVQKGGSVYVSLVPTSETPGASNQWRRLATDRS
jgi:hypothetical protein